MEIKIKINMGKIGKRKIVGRHKFVVKGYKDLLDCLDKISTKITNEDVDFSK